MKAFYFGPYREPGHFMFGPGGSQIYSSQPNECPWKPEHIDGVLQPNCRFEFMRWTHGQEIQGEAILHYREGWTAISFWDRTIDKRGA